MATAPVSIECQICEEKTSTFIDLSSNYVVLSIPAKTHKIILFSTIYFPPLYECLCNDSSIDEHNDSKHNYHV